MDGKSFIKLVSAIMEELEINPDSIAIVNYLKSLDEKTLSMIINTDVSDRPK